VDFTLPCLQALFRFTRATWELIVIDYRSTDGTGLYLAGVRDDDAAPVTVIGIAENLGFPRAVNQGLQVASGENLRLLNNDAMVTDAWLDQAHWAESGGYRQRRQSTWWPELAWFRWDGSA
jgi:O-antigen biosynthesis protein